MQTLTCSYDNCNKIYSVTNGEYNRAIKTSYKNYCSKDCQNKNRITKTLVNCNFCGTKITIRKNQITSSKTGVFYCNHSCAASYNNKTHNINRVDLLVNCLLCNEKLTIRSVNKKYCSRDCAKEAEYLQNVQKWQNGLHNGVTGLSTSHFIKKYLLRKFENKCSVCGFNKNNPRTGKTILELEHIDGDYTNNKEGNLTLLCPNCHAMTQTYKSGNRGNGRNIRRKLLD